MAETAVGLVVDKLIPVLVEEGNLLKGVRKEVRGIEGELKHILAFLKHADIMAEVGGNEINDGIKVWVDELREAAFQIDDVIDEYMHLMAQQRHRHKNRFVGFLRKIACLIVELKPRRDIASKVRELKETVEEIKRRRERYVVSSTDQGSLTATQIHSWYDPRKDSIHLKETDVVGIESSREELIGKLQGGSPQCTVISVVGMGGLGKTTLAHQVYDRVKGNFDCDAWIDVSQSYDKVKLLQNLTKEFYQARKKVVPKGGDAEDKARKEAVPRGMETMDETREEAALKRIDEMDERSVTKQLRDYLQGKSYIVIFDDVWDKDFWGHIKNSFPDNNEKSGRIVITTRFMEVADFCKTSSFVRVHVHCLQPLPPDNAWKLFCVKAFHEYEFMGHCPRHLEKLSHAIVERCEGLPLAIVLIAGLLSSKNKTIDEWRKLLTSLSSELEGNDRLASITKILSLSYNDLPYYLKSCFLYFGYFPEDYSIRCGRVIRQWIAEGFVNSKKDKSLEVVAEEYLAELINRSLVQASRIDFDGKIRSCRIHDLLREIILKKMEDLSFCRVISTKYSNFKGLTRRMSIINSSHDVIANPTFEMPHVRSIFIFDEYEMLNPLTRAIITNFKLLKVLDFEDAPNLDHLPEDIGSLFHMKYLSVRGTRVESLPKSIGKLENLETLDLKQSGVQELPVEIKRLYKLRHLLAYNFHWYEDNPISSLKGVKVKRGIGRLKALQKLYFIEANVVGVDVFEELSKLIGLRKLGITKLRCDDGRTLCDCIQKMSDLESLSVASISEDEIIDLQSMSSPPQFLRRLYLKGALRKFPEWITQLQNLVRIRISWSKLEDDPLKALQNLHNLLELGISFDAYYGEKLHFEEGTFPKLKVLKLESLSKLHLLVIEEGALCNLEEFHIGPHPQLKELPSGFQHLRKLKEVNLYEMSINFLMFQDFQSLQITGANVLLFLKIHGELWGLRLEWVMEILESIRDRDEEEWESEFENILSMLLEAEEIENDS